MLKRYRMTKLHFHSLDCSSSELPCPAKKTENKTRQIYKKDICISKDFFCDGKKDCFGGTDEENCSKNFIIYVKRP